MRFVLKLFYRSLLAFPLLLVAFSVSFFATRAYATTVIVHNDATVNTTNDTSANSGNNTTNNNGSTTIIHTGDANAQGVIINNVNTNIIKTDCNCTPTPTFSPVNPTPTPTSVVPTPTPTPGNNNGGGNNGGGGNGGGSSSGSSSSAPAATQAVLGASTLGATGTFTENMMNWVAIVGMGFVILGFFNKLKTKSFELQFELSY